MKSLIIGTAGHIDHGKTALIEAMSGFNGDEREDEKSRGITIDLSFSNIQRGDKNISFIDVPGHKRLIKNMIAGAFSFDVALLVIAIDDGVMPQTKEHLEVLQIIGIKRLVIALNKIDLANDTLISQREEEIREWLNSYRDLKIIDIIPTSIYRPQTIERLKSSLFSISPIPTPPSKLFRYYIDRVFSPKGIGTITTGTILSGRVEIGDRVNIAELNRSVTIKNIQVHSEDKISASTHQRVALNLDIPHKEIKKGYLLCSKGYFRGFEQIDISISYSTTLPPHNAEVIFISGSKHTKANILYYRDSKYAKLNLSQKVFTQFKDPYILLHNGRVCGGGEILIPLHEPIRKRQKIELLESLDKREFKRAFEILVNNHPRGFGLISTTQRFAMTQNDALSIARELDNIFLDTKELVVYPLIAQERIYSIIKEIYRKNPKAMLSASSISIRIRWASESLIKSALDRLQEEGFLIQRESIYIRSEQNSSELLDSLEERLYSILDSEGIAPMAPYNLFDDLDLDRELGKRVFNRLIKSKRVVRVSKNIFVTIDNLQKALSIMREIITSEGYIDIKNFKDSTGMSRKYLIAYLEYIDKSEEIVRDGDKRLFKYR